MLLEILQLSLISALASVFLKICIRPGMIFGWYGLLIDRVKSDFIRKPLGDCITCFSFWVNTAFCLLYWVGGSDISFEFFIFGGSASSAMASIIWRFSDL